jgi:hypothetical protein
MIGPVPDGSDQDQRGSFTSTSICLALWKIMRGTERRLPEICSEINTIFSLYLWMIGFILISINSKWSDHVFQLFNQTFTRKQQKAIRTTEAIADWYDG